MPRRSLETLFVAAAFLVVLVCTALILTPHLRRTSLSRAVLHAQPADGRHRFVFVVQARDCEGNLWFLDLLQRPELKRSFVPVGLFAGDERDLPHASARVAEHAPASALRVMSRGEAIALSSLGHPGTPYWLVIAPEGNVVLSGPAPASPDGYLRMARMLELLSSSAGSEL